MRHPRRLGISGLLALLMLVSIAPLSVSASTPVRFGAKLTHSTQPTGKESCDDYAGVHNNATCTWVAVEAFENGGHERAPKDGTIGKVRLISCQGGSFVVQVARARQSQHKAKVVRNGPKLTYVQDTQPGGCGGINGDNYKIQSFSVSLKVSKGDYIAVKAPAIGFLHNSSSGDALRVRPAARSRRLVHDIRFLHGRHAHPVPVQVASCRRASASRPTGAAAPAAAPVPDARA